MSFAGLAARSKNSSTVSLHNAGRLPTRWHRYDWHTRTPFELQHNENDAEVWVEHGDCCVFLDDASAISTCFKLNLSTLQEHDATHLLRQIKPPHRPLSLASGDGSDSGYESTHQPLTEIVVAVPSGLTVDELVEYHITSRNYFAFLHDKPLVGTSLANAARDVWTRIQRWHETGDAEAFVEYCERHGYMSFVDQPDNAIAMLSFAESARMRFLWVDAFAHCVAMQDQLSASPEYACLTNTTKALITKSSLEMDLYIRRTIKTVGTFLNIELSADRLGLSKLARDHLDQFRNMLHGCFVDKFGFYPPTEHEDEFDKCIWTEVHDDFQALYDYLADTESYNDGLSDRGATGGLCVHQNLDAFNERHNLQALPHPLPLLPVLTPTRRATETKAGIRGFKLLRTESDFKPSVRHALEKAANNDDTELLERPIVQDYIQFEASRLEGKLSVAEARKIRWLLIYCTLQMLKSLVLAPEHVSDADTAHYPLCVNVSGCPILPEQVFVPPTRTHSFASTKPALGLIVPTTDDADRISIHPDCEADNAQDFFALGRRNSVGDEEPQSATSRFAPSLPRTLSFKGVHSSVNALQRSVMGSLTRRNSMRKPPPIMVMEMPSLQDISASREYIAEYDDAIAATPTSIDEFTFDIPRNRQAYDLPVPVLEADEFEMITPSYGQDHTLDEVQSSPVSDRSNRSSTHGECETPNTQPTSRSNSTREGSARGLLASLDEDSILLTPEKPWIQNRLRSKPSAGSLSAGCYVPSGYVAHETPVSRFAKRQVYERRIEGVRDVDTIPISPVDTQLKRSNATRRQSMNDGRYTWGDLS